MEEHERIRISGVINDVTFANPENGFTVLELESGDELITAVGVMPELKAGELLELSGFELGHDADCGYQLIAAFKLENREPVFGIRKGHIVYHAAYALSSHVPPFIYPFGKRTFSNSPGEQR